MARDKIAEKELKILIANAGGMCSFPGCNGSIVEPETDLDGNVFVGDIAHIVADSQQGPRGGSKMSEEERGKSNNLLLLCKTHHSIIDKQPYTYSVAVLQQIKYDHEKSIREKLYNETSEESPITLVHDTLYGSVLPITRLPSKVFSANCTIKKSDDVKIYEKIHYPKERTEELFSYILHNNKLFAFHDLSISDGAFSPVSNCQTVSDYSAEQMWQTSDERNLYVWMLNQGLRSYLARKGVAYSKDFGRFYFKANKDGTSRKILYRPLNTKKCERMVAWSPQKRGTDIHRFFWIHLAADIRFQCVGNKQWVLCIRPEYYLTKDGTIQLDSEKIGPIVTRRKSLLRNKDYLTLLHFWVSFLSGGTSHICLNFGNQAVFINSKLIEFSVDWAGVPNDSIQYKNTSIEEDLFSMTEKNEFLIQEESDEVEL
ncbi:hypothetical protein FACS189427_07840 [Planctomycetales bacterium]|nr:hypothetical protein FACS189427_07840 [Planctomycetales bacterium]